MEFALTFLNRCPRCGWPLIFLLPNTLLIRWNKLSNIEQKRCVKCKIAFEFDLDQYRRERLRNALPISIGFVSLLFIIIGIPHLLTLQIRDSFISISVIIFLAICINVAAKIPCLRLSKK